jgi:uncharacterized delta-60 repeat protein
MNRKPLVETISLIAKAAAPVTAVATSLAAPLAHAASGDLDPSFADHGRLAAILGAEGAVYSVEALEDGGAFIGGGDIDHRGYYCWYYCDFVASSFAEGVAEDGALDSAYHAFELGGIEAFGFARQDDGKVVAAGRWVAPRGQYTLGVFRLNSDGSLDTGFGTDGSFEWSPGDAYAAHQARSLVIDAGGRIVVAGARTVIVGDHVEDELVVLRLLGDGSIDESFGQGGVYARPGADLNGDVRLARTPAGALRVASAGAGGCEITGLNANGGIDAAFGSGGVTSVYTPGAEPVTCDSLVALDDGKLLVAGSAAGHGYATRLLANGAPDPAFLADPALADAMAEATAIEAAAGGKVLVAGSGINGASIMRLQATGELDALFGDNGRTWIDLPTENGSGPVFRDIAVRADGSVIAAGGDYWADRGFLVRLLGDAGEASAGVVSFIGDSPSPQESDGQAIVRVRRSGGSDGEISVHYSTVANENATAGADYTEKSGILHWADGDASEQEIAVDIAQDNGPGEPYEWFAIALDDPQGGAGLGTSQATISIQPDGAPWGQIEIPTGQDDLVAEAGYVEFYVSRDYYAQGEVSVTVSVEGITATAGEDFIANPVTVTWGPDENGWKPIQVQLVNDTAQEDAETFRIVLSNPTGGAILGASSEHVVEIIANDAPPPPSRHGGGGGGAAGFLSLFLLGFAEILRAARRHLRDRA